MLYEFLSICKVQYMQKLKTNLSRREQKQFRLSKLTFPHIIQLTILCALILIYKVVVEHTMQCLSQSILYERAYANSAFLRVLILFLQNHAMPC